MAAGNNKGLVRVVINHPLFLIGLKATVGVVLEWLVHLP